MYQIRTYPEARAEIAALPTAAALGYAEALGLMRSLARVVGVEPTTVGRWERGETSPQPGVRRKLAEALKVSVEQLDALLAEGQPVEEKPSGVVSQAGESPAVEVFDDCVLSALWNHRGTVEAAVALRGGGRVKRRVFGWLTGLALTAPAHQWLVHEPGALVSGLSGRRVSATLVDRFTAMVAELRRMDDVAGGGTVLSLAAQEFDLVAGLLNRAVYDEGTGRALHILLAELGQLAGWAAYDGGDHPLAQRYWIAALRATHSADERVLGAHVLSCMAEQADQAAAVLNEALALFDGSLPRGRMGYLIALTDVLARPGKQRDLDAAAARGMEAIQLVETLDSTRSVGLIRDAEWEAGTAVTDTAAAQEWPEYNR